MVQRIEGLKSALSGIKLGDSAANENIKNARTEMDSLRQVIDDLIKKYNEFMGTSLHLEDDEKSANQARTAIEAYINSLSKVETKQKALSNVENAVTRWMGFYQVLNLTKRAINDMKQHIQELDAVMTKIAVVTNMTTDDLWNQIGKYSEIAR
jgi:chromosome segregation ATPase